MIDYDLKSVSPPSSVREVDGEKQTFSKLTVMYTCPYAYFEFLLKNKKSLKREDMSLVMRSYADHAPTDQSVEK